MTISKARQAEIASMPLIPCACGCGALIAPINKKNKPAKYAHGHNPDGAQYRFKRGQTAPMKGRRNPVVSAVHKGKQLSQGEIAQRTNTRLRKHGGVYQVKRGWKHTPETIGKMTIAVRKRDLKGGQNPFYGKKHTDETKRMISEKKSGENNPHWHGGTSTLPYGPEFTRKFKRLIRERDNYTCQRCGKTQEENGRTLQIHHVDHDKMNNDPTNLVTVCNACNVWCSYHRDEPFQRIK